MDSRLFTFSRGYSWFIQDSYHGCVSSSLTLAAILNIQPG
jgi:hypothetical protein